MITITRAPPYLTVQDSGRTRSRSAGVPRGGAMDSFALGATNALVGNALSAAVLEWALGGGTLRFDTECVFALGGATAVATLSGSAVPPLTTTRARAGDELAVEGIASGRFLYLGFAGGIDVPVVLHSRSTYLPGRFGGYEGRLVRSGDSIRLGPRNAAAPGAGFHFPAELIPDYRRGGVRITRGPQADLFGDAPWGTLVETEFLIASASDRTGYRLDGPALTKSAPTLPSEAGCQGAIQVPGDGKPITLMADAPTVGGYPKMAIVSEADLPILAQRSPGEGVRFELVAIEQSQRALRRRVSDLHTLRQLAGALARGGR